MSEPDSALAARAQFTTTHWSVVLSAGRANSPKARDALEKLCHAYGFPLYAFVRRKGFDAAEAQDLTQEFFVHLLERQDLATVHPDKGKFRTFLLIALSHFLANEWERLRTEKRGGKLVFISLEEAAAENHYQSEPATDLTPEKMFERRWAIALLDQALARLRDEAESAGKGQLFDELKIFISGRAEAGDYADAAKRLAMTQVAVRVAVHRLRQRYRDSLRHEIAQTVGSREEVDEEIRHLFTAFS